MLVHRLRDGPGEQLAIDRQGGAGRHARDLGGVHDERVEPAHLFLQQADGVIQLVAAERVAADELGESIGFMNFCRPDRPHLVNDDGDSAGGCLPRRFASGQAAADDVNAGLQVAVQAGTVSGSSTGASRS
jgi:hypothetical protein